jgi:hypothetical protein
MSWDSAPAPPLRGRLARHLGRLQQSLDTVGEQVRQAVAKRHRPHDGLGHR